MLVAVGPSGSEVERLGDLLASFDRWVGEPAIAVAVNDGNAGRDLADRVGTPLQNTIVESPHLARPAAQNYMHSIGICGTVLTGLSHIATHHSEVELVLKVDTDSLVIAPFAERLRRYFSEHPSVGIVGSYTRTPNGGERDFTITGQSVERLLHVHFHRRRPWRTLRQWLEPRRRTLARHIRQAQTHGYRLGEHCQGGGYAISRPCIAALERAGLLDDPQRWIGIDCPEDTLTCMFVRSLGRSLGGQVDEGQVFGVRYRGLAYPPHVLVEKGYAVIHSVKNDDDHTEASIRHFFAERRDAERVAD